MSPNKTKAIMICPAEIWPPRCHFSVHFVLSKKWIASGLSTSIRRNSLTGTDRTGTGTVTQATAKLFFIFYDHLNVCVSFISLLKTVSTPFPPGWSESFLLSLSLLPLVVVNCLIWTSLSLITFHIFFVSMCLLSVHYLMHSEVYSRPLLILWTLNKSGPKWIIVYS